jgi:peptidoglycan/xylan/chitin deacetylase (PgdA/CDA1 family)
MSTNIRRLVKTAVLHSVYYSGLYRLIARRYSGVGTIFVMHRVLRDEEGSLAPRLTTTADFLDRVLVCLAPEVDFVTMDEVWKRLSEDKIEKGKRPFVALTFDDGFRDSLTVLLPLLRRHGVPATVYVVSGAPDRSLDPWPWRLERAIQEQSELALDICGLPRRLSVRTFSEKRAAFELITEFIHLDIEANRHIPESLLSRSCVSDEALIAEHFVSWDELRELASDPLVTIGAHTITHRSLRDLDQADAVGEIRGGKERLQAELDVLVCHFAYPYGQRSNCGPREFALAVEAGFRTAVTLRNGNIYHQHGNHLMSLPRFSLGGIGQRLSSAILSVSGAPTALGSRWRNPVVTV